MEFSIRHCKFYKSGLATPHCTRNGTPELDYCHGECDYWMTIDGETHEDILYRVVLHSGE